MVTGSICIIVYGLQSACVLIFILNSAVSNGHSLVKAPEFPLFVEVNIDEIDLGKETNLFRTFTDVIMILQSEKNK